MGLANQKTVRVFVYGELQNKGSQRIRTQGQLRLRPVKGDHPDAAAHFSPLYASYVWGQELLLSSREFDKLVKFEAPEYTPISVMTNAGLMVAFECIVPAWRTWKIIPTGRFPVAYRSA